MNMKSTALPWAPCIPQNWQISSLLKALRAPISDGPHETPRLTDYGIPFISIDSLTDEPNIDFGSCSRYISQEDYINYCKKTKIESGDILFSKSATIGKTAIVTKPIDFMIWSPLAIIKTNGLLLNNKYLYYSLKCPGLLDQIRLSGGMSTQVNVGMRELERQAVLIPPVSQQIEIVNYLDRKTSRINNIIAKKQQLLSRLSEYRQSVITQAVTKGLDPNVEMKDSGVEWIGNIPKHWNVEQSKYLVSIENGSDPELPGDVPVYGSGAESFKTCGEYKIGPTVLLGRKGATLHIPHFVDGKYWNVDTAFNTRTKNNDISIRFFYYLSTCFDYHYYISQTTLPSMTQTDYGNMKLPIPPRSEQDKICSFIANKCANIDEICRTIEVHVAKLNDYRSSLITAAVTGQIDCAKEAA